MARLRPPTKDDETATGDKASEPVGEEANLDAGACAVGDELHKATAGRIAAEDERGNVDRVAGRKDLALEFAELSFAGREQAKGVAANRGLAPAATTVRATDGTNTLEGLKRPGEESA